MIFGASRPRRPRASSREARRTTAEPVHDAELPPKLIPSVRSLVSTAVALAHTRLALAGIELEEEMQRLITAAALGFASLILVLLALVVGTFTIVAAAPEEHRVATMLAITVVYLIIAIVLVLRLKAIFTNRPAIFSGTLAELEKDKETLSQMTKAHEAAEAEAEFERQRVREERSSRTARQGAN